MSIRQKSSSVFTLSEDNSCLPWNDGDLKKKKNVSLLSGQLDACSGGQDMRARIKWKISIMR